jgi:hypothetical protein
MNTKNGFTVNEKLRFKFIKSNIVNEMIKEKLEILNDAKKSYKNIPLVSSSDNNNTTNNITELISFANEAKRASNQPIYENMKNISGRICFNWLNIIFRYTKDAKLAASKAQKYRLLLNENKGYIHKLIHEVEDAHLFLQKVIRALTFLREWSNKDNADSRCDNKLYKAEEVGKMAFIHAEWAMLEFDAAQAMLKQVN